MRYHLSIRISNLILVVVIFFCFVFLVASRSLSGRVAKREIVIYKSSPRALCTTLLHDFSTYIVNIETNDYPNIYPVVKFESDRYYF